MNSLWLDIEEYLNGKYQIGFLVVDKKNNEIRGYETFIDDKNIINEILVNNNISKIYVFNENDSNFLKKLVYIDEDKYKIINIYKNYEKLIENSKLQISKNSDIAKAAGINIDLSRLHSPLYDIQLSYCSYHNYSISNVDEQLDMIYDSFFVLTGKLDIYWSLIKTWSINTNIIETKMVYPKQFNNRYFMIGDNISKNEIIFKEYNTLDEVKFEIKLDNIENIINFFENNIILFLNSKDQKELSKKLWNLLYYSNLRYNNKVLLYIFFGINLSRFKNKIANFSIEAVKNELDNELSLENLLRINKKH